MLRGRAAVLKTSKNELLAALAKAFEGIGFDVGDYEDAAQMVTWAETHGLRGLAQLQAALPHLIGRTNLPIELIQAADRLIVLDAEGGSTLVYGGEAVDLAYTQARHNGFGAVQLRNCRNRKLIIERLVNTARRRGMACVAYWRQSVNTAVDSVVSVAAHAECPAYREYLSAERAVDREPSLVILCGPDLSVLQEQVTAVVPASSRKIANVDPKAMSSAYRDALEYGIDMDIALWENLQQLIKNVLVEATATSRAGAGD